MTSQAFEDSESIRHFQSICDACQQLINSFHTPAELKLYADGYLHALRKSKRLSLKDQEKLEAVRTELGFETITGRHKHLLQVVYSL